MTIECYYVRCPHHGCNETSPDEGPFCYEHECIMPESIMYESFYAQLGDSIKEKAAESGADREADFNLEDFAEAEYEKWLRTYDGKR